MRHGRTLAQVLLAILALQGVCTVAHGQQYYLADERLGTRTVPLFLLTRPDVQADLKLSPEQIKAAVRVIDRLYTKAESIRGQGNTKEVIRIRAELDEAQTQWLRTSLSETQNARLVQLDLQWEGPAALVRPVIAESLRITPEQQTALVKVLRSSKQGTTQHAISVQALSILSVPQRDSWKAMLGEPFRFQRTASRSETANRR